MIYSVLNCNQMHCCQGLCPLVSSWAQWFTVAHCSLGRGGLGILGIPQSAKIIDNALSLTSGQGIDEWLTGHKSDSCGSAPCHTLTHPSSSQLNAHTHLNVSTCNCTVKQPLCTSQNTHAAHSHTLTSAPTRWHRFKNGLPKITTPNLVLNLSICARFKNKEQRREAKLDPFVFLSIQLRLLLNIP